MPQKIVMAKYGEHEIRVENTWFSGATLFIDGGRVKKNNDYLALKNDKPLMAAKVKLEGAERLVEVYVSALFTIKIKICVDGMQIGGEEF